MLNELDMLKTLYELFNLDVKVYFEKGEPKQLQQGNVNNDGNLRRICTGRKQSPVII